MVKQYDIISIDLEPTKGQEKGKKRPCLVISRTEFTQVTKFAWVLPITNRKLRYPTDIALVTKDNKVKGIVDCAQIRALDLKSRSHIVVDTLDKVVINDIRDVVFNILELLSF